MGNGLRLTSVRLGSSRIHSERYGPPEQSKSRNGLPRNVTIQCLHNIIVTLFMRISKSTRHRKSQEVVTSLRGKGSTGAHSKVGQLLELQTRILKKLLHYPHCNHAQRDHGKQAFVNQEIGETENIFLKNQIRNFRNQKFKLWNFKNSLDGLNNRINHF